LLKIGDANLIKMLLSFSAKFPRDENCRLHNHFIFIYLKASTQIRRSVAEFGRGNALAMVASGLKMKEPSKRGGL